MTDDTNDIDDVFADAQTGDRHTTEPEAGDDRPLDVLVADHLERIKDGDASNMAAARGDRTAALVRAIDDADELERVVQALVAESDLDESDVRASKSGLMKVAVRVALKTVRPDILDDAEDGLSRYQDRTSGGY